jgi:hypothetical protein
VKRAAAAIAVWLTACGSEPAPREPVASTGPLSFEQHVTRIDELAVRGCACKDRRCVGAIEQELASMVAAVQLVAADPALLESTVPARADALERLAVCMTDHEVASPRYGDALLAQTQKLRDLVCEECRDRACSKSLSVALAPETDTVDWFPVDYDDLVALRPLINDINRCAEPNAAVEAAFSDLEGIRADACACKDAACADAVRGRFNTFLGDHEDAVGTEEEAIQIGELVRAMNKCLDTARGEPPP